MLGGDGGVFRIRHFSVGLNLNANKSYCDVRIYRIDSGSVRSYACRKLQGGIPDKMGTFVAAFVFGDKLVLGNAIRGARAQLGILRLRTTERGREIRGLYAFDVADVRLSYYNGGLVMDKAKEYCDIQKNTDLRGSCAYRCCHCRLRTSRKPISDLRGDILRIRKRAETNV